jgi:predicted tellurium resistance membrane protein TerC
MFMAVEKEEEFDPEKNWAFRMMKKYFRTTNDEPHGKFFIGKIGNYFSPIINGGFMLALIDIVFAVDSIPAVFFQSFPIQR